VKKLTIVMVVLFSFILVSCADDESDTAKISNGVDETEKGGDPKDTTGGEEYAVSDSDHGSQENADSASAEPEKSDEKVVSDEDSSPEVSDEDVPQPGELVENPFVESSEEPVSTFSIDVDTASYSLIRSYLMNYYRLPPEDSVRIEEMINYFAYIYPQPEEGKPFSVTMEMAPSPWSSEREIIMIGLQGREMDPSKLPASNLVFLIDVSGSMSSSNKLPLLKTAFKKLVKELGESDTVSIVTYAGSAGVKLDSVSGSDKATINSAIDGMESGGSTAGSDGLNKAYEIAEKNFNADGNNRVILASDGDFNVGPSSDAEMEKLITEKREKGIFLTVLGFGMGNYKDSKMETLADKGNGNYFYIDSEREADKVFVHDLLGNMFTIAKDVKIQVEFNPLEIERYRLIGYENRVMENRDFNDDTKDAGEIGSGHRVTAFYEVERVVKSAEPRLEPEEEFIPVDFKESELMELRMRYKEPDQDVSKYLSEMLTKDLFSLEMSENMMFASAVTEFGMLLRKSEFRENSSYDSVTERALQSIGTDLFGYRGEFIELVEKAKELDK